MMKEFGTYYNVNVDIFAGDSISVTASTLFAANDMLLQAVLGNVTLNAAQDESYMSSQSKKSQVGLMPTSDGINFFEASGKKSSMYSSTNVGNTPIDPVRLEEP